jgi:hypothetical protein
MSRRIGPKEIGPHVGIKPKPARSEGPDGPTGVEGKGKNLPAVVGTDSARLPVVYEKAKRALAACGRIDECKDWADRAAALASYARQAKDDTLFNHARRIQARATRRQGELLKEIKAPGKRTDKPTAATVHRLSQKEAGAAAGLSERQIKTSVNVANVPNEEFEKQVEDRKPPSVSEMAEQGKTNKQIRAERKAELAGTSLGEQDELKALCELPPRRRDDLIKRAKAGEKVSAKTALKHYEFEGRAERMVQWCTTIAEYNKVPPGLPRERARKLLEGVEEACTGLNALRNGLRAIVDSEPKAKPDCHRCKGEGVVTVLLKNKEARIPCDCKNPRPRVGRPGAQCERVT